MFYVVILSSAWTTKNNVQSTCVIGDLITQTLLTTRSNTTKSTYPTQRIRKQPGRGLVITTMPTRNTLKASRKHAITQPRISKAAPLVKKIPTGKVMESAMQVFTNGYPKSEEGHVNVNTAVWRISPTRKGFNGPTRVTNTNVNLMTGLGYVPNAIGPTTKKKDREANAGNLSKFQRNE